MPANRAAIERLFDGVPPYDEKSLQIPVDEMLPVNAAYMRSLQRIRQRLKKIQRVRIQSKKLSKRTKKVAEQALCDELNKRFNESIWP